MIERNDLGSQPAEITVLDAMAASLGADDAAFGIDDDGRCGVIDGLPWAVVHGLSVRQWRGVVT